MSNNEQRRTSNDTRHRTTLGNRFRFLVRALGLTGILAAPAGYAVAGDSLPAWPTALTAEALRPYGERLLALANGAEGVQAQVGTILFAAGVVAIMLLLLHELLAGLFLASGRKTAVGTNSTLQIALAAALLVIVNAVSFNVSKRYDLTRDKQFTLPADLVDELKKLRPDSPTTVVVLQLHKTAGTLSDKPDAYDGAAERKVVEKVTDLVAQLREFGPRFNVVVLDVQDEGFDRELKKLTDPRPGLKEAIAAAPENSLFFYADGRSARPAIARMSFTDFYQLDKTASKEATPAERDRVSALAGGLAYAPGVRGRGNLVLLPRGKAAFVRKVLSLEERKPKVGLAVIHPLLTTREEYDGYSAGGLRKALEANGFEVADVILKRWGGRSAGGPTPAADTFEEYEIDRVESRYNLATLLVADRERQIASLTEFAGKLKDIPLATLDRQFGRQLGRKIATEADRALIKQVFETTLTVRREELAEFNKALAELAPRYREVFANERAAEGRRQTDVKAKFAATVADCDLLIVPRLTAIDLTKGDIIPPNLFNLAKEQAEVVKEFVAAGKPVLFAVGPTNIDRGRGAPPGGSEPDDVEKLLPQLGIELGKQTVLTPVEAEAMAERQNEALGLSVDLPPLVFDKPGSKPANPVGTAYRVTARAVDQKLEVKKGGFRPVYVKDEVAGKLAYAAEFAWSQPDAWNEDRPLAEEDYLPKFDPAKPDDPKKGTKDEERRGSFPIGVAVEVPVPGDWLPSAATKPDVAAVAGGAATDTKPNADGPPVRIVALGSGGLFTGKRLEPANETLLLHAVNWQLRRDDRLPQELADADKWRFPRADLSRRQFNLWWAGMQIGLPAVIVYLGLLTLMARKVR